MADREFTDRFGEINFINPGFVNLKISDDFLKDSIKDVFATGDEFGASDIGKGVKINLEFVSGNPTGPLTVGNARAASYGDTLGNVLKMPRLKAKALKVIDFKITATKHEKTTNSAAINPKETVTGLVFILSSNHSAC